jgi:hypothetical protein
MTKFIKPNAESQKSNRFHIYRYSDGTEAYSARRPRIDSKYRDSAHFLIWDNERKCVADE